MVSLNKECAERLAALPIDGHFDLLDYPHDVAAIRRLRNGIGMNRAALTVRFKIRTIPSGGIRLIRGGTWDSWACGTQYVETTTLHAFTAGTRSKSKALRPAIFWLGYEYNPSQRIARRACSEKACPFPAIHRGLCRHHKRYMKFPASLMGDGIEPQDLWNPRNPHVQTPLYADWQPRSIERLELSLKFDVGWHRKLDSRHRNAGGVLTVGEQ